MKEKIKSYFTKTNILRLVLVILICGFIYTTYNFFHILYNEHKSNTLITDLQKDNEKNVPIKPKEDVPIETETENPKDEEQYTYDFKKLQEQNPDTIAWLEIPDISLSYPLVQTKDNSYYLNHSFDKSRNINGWVFLNSLNNADMQDQNSVIFGHNSLFKPLRKIFDNNNKGNFNIYLYNETEIITYEVFSMYKTVSYDVKIIEEKLSQDLINELIKKSNYNYNVEVKDTDNILTLSTCYNDRTERIIVHAKRLTASN